METQASMAFKQARLEQCYRRSTRYEIVAEFGGARYLLGYRTGQSKGELVNLARARGGDELVRMSGITDADLGAYTRATGWTFGSKLRIGRTGRTERDAILEGELPKIQKQEAA